MLGSGDGAGSTLNSMSKPGTQNKTTQKLGGRTAHERSKKPNTTSRKTGARQKAHQRQEPGEPDRRGQKGQGGSRTQVSPFTFFGRFRFLGRRPFFVARFWSRRPLGRETGVSSVSIPIPKGAHARPRRVAMDAGASKLSPPCSLPRGWRASRALVLPRAPTRA